MGILSSTLAFLALTASQARALREPDRALREAEREIESLKLDLEIERARSKSWQARYEWAVQSSVDQHLQQFAFSSQYQELQYLRQQYINMQNVHPLAHVMSDWQNVNPLAQCSLICNCVPSRSQIWERQSAGA